MSSTVLVTGATGRQGGAVARVLLSRNVGVRALVRDASSGPSRDLAARGADLVVGDFDDSASLQRACEGASAVFSVQRREMNKYGYGLQQSKAVIDDSTLRLNSEVDRGKNLVMAAVHAGVPQFVYSSASGVGRYTMPLESEVDRKEALGYAESKGQIEHAVRTAGFEFWTILRPAFFLENFLFYLSGDRLITGFAASTKLPVVATQDIGLAAAAAVEDPSRFDGVELELASAVHTVPEIADAMATAWGRSIDAPSLSMEEAVEAGLPAATFQIHQRANLRSMPARPEYAEAFGLRVTTCLTWAQGTQAPK